MPPGPPCGTARRVTDPLVTRLLRFWPPPAGGNACAVLQGVVYASSAHQRNLVCSFVVAKEGNIAVNVCTAGTEGFLGWGSARGTRAGIRTSRGEHLVNVLSYFFLKASLAFPQGRG